MKRISVTDTPEPTIKLSLPARADIPYHDRVLVGLMLIRKYAPDAYLAAEHDIVFYGDYTTRDLMTPEEQALLAAWGWHEGFESWAHYA